MAIKQFSVPWPARFIGQGLAMRSLRVGRAFVRCAVWPGRCAFLFLIAAFAFSAPVLADPPAVQIDEALAGANGDTRIQFIELKLLSPADALWGPQSGESEGRLRLLFFDATGAQTGEYVFPSDAPVGAIDPINGGYSVLLATQEFADVAGMPPPDFIIPKSLIVQNGKVCFTGNPDNPNAPMLNLCLSYGNFVAIPAVTRWDSPRDRRPARSLRPALLP